MKLTSEEQKEVNDFFRSYVDTLRYKNPMNSIRLNVDHTDEHRRTIFEVCNALIEERIPFWTEVRLKCGCIPDIVCPTNVKPIIEVLSSETVEDFYQKKHHKYPPELQNNSIILVDAKKKFEIKEIM